MSALRSGTSWAAHSWLQLAGFMICVFGTLLYNDIITLPFMRAEPVDETSRALMPTEEEMDMSVAQDASSSLIDREMNNY